MAFYCEPCQNVMTESGWGFTQSVGPCECCQRRRLCTHLSHYTWSDKNRQIAADARKAIAEQEKSRSVVDKPDVVR